METAPGTKRILSDANLQAFYKLHSFYCSGTEADVAKMKTKLEQDPQILEQTCELGYSSSSLIMAVESGHVLCVEFLVKYGRDVYPTSNLRHAFSRAIESSNKSNNAYKDIAKILLYCTGNPDEIINPGVVHNMTSEEIVDIVELVLQSGVDPCKITIERFATCLPPLIHSLIFEEYSMLSHDGSDRDRDLDYDTDTFMHSLVAIPTVMKLMFFYKGTLSLTLNNLEERQMGTYCASHFTVCKNLLEGLLESFRCVNILHKFGVNLWKHGGINIVSETHRQVLEEIEKLRSSPLSLKCLSRVSVMNTMGSKFYANYKKLEIPSELKAFLEYPDV